MPPKIRQLTSVLHHAAFTEDSGKGSHRKFRHPSGVRVILSGNLGDDADRYQIREVEEALRKVKNEGK